MRRASTVSEHLELSADAQPRKAPASRRYRLTYALAVALVLLNFVWAFAEASSIGGTALGGKVVDGHYFVNQGRTYTEVSKATWEWSFFHMALTMTSIALLVLLMTIHNYRQRPRRAPVTWTPS
jgi:hypothetical protein